MINSNNWKVLAILMISVLSKILVQVSTINRKTIPLKSTQESIIINDKKNLSNETTNALLSISSIFPIYKIYHILTNI